MSVFTAAAWSASTVSGAGFEAAKAGDGFIGASRWASTATGAPQWLQRDEGSAKVATWYQVAPGDSSTGQNPVAWTFEGSNDASSWTTIDTRTSVSFSSKAQTYTVTSAAYRYHRLNVTTINGATTLSVAEFRVGDQYPPSWLDDQAFPTTTHSGNFTLGRNFTAAVDGYITHLSYPCNGGSNTGTVNLRLYSAAAAVLTSVSDVQTGKPKSRVEVELATPYAITAGTTYRVAAYIPTSSWSPGGGPGSAITAGDLTALANGAFYNASDTYPNTDGTAVYAVGVRFVRALPSTTLNLTSPAAAATAATSPCVVTFGTVALTSPTAQATATAAPALLTSGAIALTSPTATAAAAAAPAVVTLSGLALTSPTATATATADPASLDVVTGVSLTSPTATATAAAAPAFVDAPGEALTVTFDDVILEDLLYIELAAAADLDIAVPILSEKHPSPVLSAEQPTHQAWVDYTPTTSVVGFAHLWVDGIDITYFRGKPTLVRNWTKEVPWGDKTAMWEMPQLDPWDVPGEGDLSFIRKGAKVVIGIVDDETGAVTRKWSGFYHARRKGFDSAEDYVFEAHGTMWAAMFQAIEPVPYQAPIDIGVLIPRLLNGLIGRPFNLIPEKITGRKTRYRGARDEKVWQAVQNILAKDGWTADGRQWTLKQVADDEFRMVLKSAMTTIDGTVAWGNPGVDFDLTVDEDSRVDGIFCRWVVKGGGESANVKYPGLELLDGLPYPNADAGDFLNLGATDGGTTSGTGVSDLQRRLIADGYANGLRVSGVITSAWVEVVRDAQEALGITVDGSVGPQTWTAIFTTVDESIDLTPRRLPMAVKPNAWPTVDGSNGQILRVNPAFDGLPPNFVYLDMGTNITRREVQKNAQTYLAVNGEAVVTGTAQFRGCLDDLARTDLDIGQNVKVRGFDGEDVVLQVGRLSVNLDTNEGAYVVAVDADERARDALTIDQILERNRDALPDPARRPGNPNRSSRLVRDEGFSWDADSRCGKLTRTPVNGNTGLWTRKVIPFAEVGQLSGIRLHTTVPFAAMLMASLRFTPNMARNLVGNPFASTDPYRDHMATLDEFGFLAAWGAQGDACGYSGSQESDGKPFTGLFSEKTTLEYVTETGPYVALFLFARGDSGFVWGFEDGDGFLPARQT